MKKYVPYSTRDAIKNYFPLPNEIYSLGLSAGEISVYGFLMRCENRSTHQCHPSYATIGRAVNLSNNTVRKHVLSLTDKHLISTEPTTIITRKGEKRNGSLLYTIRPIEEAIRWHLEHKIRSAEEERIRQRLAERLAIPEKGISA